MQYSVVFAPEAQQQLDLLYQYIADAASPEIAYPYTSAIINYCESLQRFPHRGTRRDDVRPGLRVTNYKGRTVIAFDIVADQVSIIGVFYGGQDYESLLRGDDDALS
jgi:plasmid stabilization system protein ParE